MDRLKSAKSAIKRATDSLVKAAQDSIKQEEEAPVAIKADIFKEVKCNGPTQDLRHIQGVPY